MAEYEGMDEATLQQKLDAATSYDERSAIRQALRQMKKERGEQVGSARKGQPGYNRFVATKPVGKPSSKSYVHSDSSTEHSAAVAVTSPISPTHVAAKKKDAPGVRASSSPSPFTLDLEPSTAPLTEKDSAASRPSDPCSPPIARQRDGGRAVVPVVRTLSPPPPLSPGNAPRDSGKMLCNKVPENECTPSRNGACEDEEVNIEKKDEALIGDCIVKTDYKGEEEGLVEAAKELEEEEEKPLVKEEVVKEEEEEREEEEEEEVEHSRNENLAESKTERQLDEPDIAPVRIQHPLPQKVTPPPQETPLPQQTSGPQGLKHKIPNDPKNSRDERKDTTKFDFGVKLKQRPKSPTEKKTTTMAVTTESIPNRRDAKGGEVGGLGGDTAPRQRAQTVAVRQKDKPTSTGGGGGPRTLRDFQELAAKAKSKKSQEDKPSAPLDNTLLYAYLNAYVCKELSLPASGTSLYDVCSNSANLCKLINKSVPNTVDMRALTQISSTATKRARDEAEQENMTLVTESARAIGCHIFDTTGDKILCKDPETIRNLLVDLIRARVVNMPGMDEEPATVFQDMRALFVKLGVKVTEESADAVDAGIDVHEEGEQEKKGSSSNDSWRDRHLREEEVSPPQAPKTWRERPLAGDTIDSSTYEDRAAHRKAVHTTAQENGQVVPEHRERQRETSEKISQKNDQKDPLTDKLPEAPTYEERAAIRRAERERRLKEREALATAK